MANPKLSYYFTCGIREGRVRFRMRGPVVLGTQVYDGTAIATVRAMGWEGDKFVVHVGPPFQLFEPPYEPA